jgi:hypothetical protein
VKHALRTKSVGTKVSEAELRVLESRAAAAGLTLSEWVRDVLLGSSVDAGTMGRWPSHDNRSEPCEAVPRSSRSFVQYQEMLYTSLSGDPLQQRGVEDELGRALCEGLSR